MAFRGVVPDKQKLISLLESAFTRATSQLNFYKRLQQQGIELYSRNGVTVGAKLKRKFRFRTLGYTKTILQELDKNISQNKRLKTLKRIRESDKGRLRNIRKR